MQMAEALNRSVVLPFYSDATFPAFSAFHTDAPEDKRWAFLDLFAESSLGKYRKLIPGVSIITDSYYGARQRGKCTWVEIDFTNKIQDACWINETLILPKDIDLSPSALSEVLIDHRVVCVKEFRGFGSNPSVTFRTNWKYIVPQWPNTGDMISCLDISPEIVDSVSTVARNISPFTSVTLGLEKVFGEVWGLPLSDSIREFRLVACTNAVAWILYDVSTRDNVLFFHDIGRSTTFYRPSVVKSQSLRLLETAESMSNVTVVNCDSIFPCPFYHFALASHADAVVHLGASAFHALLGRAVSRRNGTTELLADVCSLKGPELKPRQALVSLKPRTVPYHRAVADFCSLLLRGKPKPLWLETWSLSLKTEMSKVFGSDVARQLHDPKRNSECVVVNRTSAFCFPTAFLLGPMKTGTTTIFDHLQKHPEVSKSVKETYFFEQASTGRKYGDARMAALGKFSSYVAKSFDSAGQGGKVFIDGTALLFASCSSKSHDFPRFLHMVSPNAKLMFGTRGRESACSSLFRYGSRDNKTADMFQHTIGKEISQLLRCIQGMNDIEDWETACVRPYGPLWCSNTLTQYMEEVHLSAFMRYFSAADILRINVTSGDTKESMRKVARFLGLSQAKWENEGFDERSNVNSRVPPFPIPDATRRSLMQIFTPFFLSETSFLSGRHARFPRQKRSTTVFVGVNSTNHVQMHLNK